MDAPYQSITAEELAEYRAIILRNGLDINNYQLREAIPKMKVLPSSTEPRATVTVKNIKTNKEKVYPSGTGSPWLVKFEDDLKKQEF